MYIVQIPLSGYGGRSELYIVNMPVLAHQESMYYHSVRADCSAETTVISAVVANRGNQMAFVNAVALKGTLLIVFFKLKIYFIYFYEYFCSDLFKNSPIFYVDHRMSSKNVFGILLDWESHIL